jgi:CheY-like chemotaxis protein
MVLKVLVVDDSKLARMAVAKVLGRLHPDWIRVEAANADEAIAALEEQKPDLAVLDFNMPAGMGWMSRRSFVGRAQRCPLW